MNVIRHKIYNNRYISIVVILWYCITINS